MKKFKVKQNDKTYIVQAKDAKHAAKLTDAATQLATINALVTDEQAAISAYNVAIENLDGVVDPKYIEVLRSIVKEENKHIENLQAIITGNVTEKNIEDSVKDFDAAYAANLAEELASALNRDKLVIAKHIFEELTRVFKGLNIWR